jgi:hypothetical protein
VETRQGWSERRNWVYGLVSAALAGLIVVVVQAVLGIDPGDNPSPTASRQPFVATDPSPGADADERAAAADEPVVTASVTYPRDTCSSFVVPGALDGYGPAPEPQELGPWVRDRDGATTGEAQILVTVTGHGERPVTITSLTFAAGVRSAEPLVGSSVANDCGDQTIARYAKVDLDRSPPQIVESSAVEVSVGDMSTSPLVFPYEVTSTENENLLLIASTLGYVEWTAMTF